MRAAWLIPGVAMLVGLAWIGGSYHQSTRSPSPKQLSGHAADPELDDRRPVTTFVKEQRRNDDQEGSRPHALAAIPRSLTVAPPEDSPAPEDVAARLEFAFEQDGAPTVNSRHMAQSIRTAFGQAKAPGAYVKNVECRASRCRADLEFQNIDADKSVLREVLHESEAIPYAFTIPTRNVDESGKVSLSIYFYPSGEAPYSL
jgi:hypothetical protein